jgi:hypothetical protein
MSLLFAFFLACSGPDALPALAPPEAEVVLRVSDKKVDEGDPVVVQVESIAAPGWDVQVGQPGAEGLALSLVQTDGPMQVGERELTRWTYHLSGEPGSYIVSLGPSGASGPDQQTRSFSPPPVFVDISVQGPSGGPMAGFHARPAEAGWPWTVWAAIAAGVLLFLGLIALAIRRWRKHPELAAEPVPDPPDVVALREWAAARADKDMGDSVLALELSRVLRVYLESICAWPATSRTTREILRFLEQEGAGARRLDVTDRMRSGRILDATDRLKFAREGGGEAFFVALDSDFQAVVDATRPLGMAEVSGA